MIKRGVTVTALIITVASIVIFYPRFSQLSAKKAQARKGDLKVTVYTSGRITAENIANLSFKSTGRIANLPFKENSMVAKGAVVAALDPEILRAVVDKTISSENSARAAFDEFIDVNRWDNLDPQVIHKRAQYQEAWERAKNDLSIAKANLNDSVLVSPFDGTVTKVTGEVNEWTSVFSSEPLVQIVDFGSLYFEAEVAEEHSGQVFTGQEAIVTLDAGKGTPVHGKIIEVAKTTRTNKDGDVIVPVKIKFDVDPDSLIFGSEGNAQVLIRERKDILLIPKSAVEKISGRYFVTVAKGDKKEVTLGDFDGDNWEATSGLNIGDEILLKE